MKQDEGYIKYGSHWMYGEPVPQAVVQELQVWRDKLFAHGLIGSDADGVGYGNISIRDKQGFIITGTQTGGLQTLGTMHFTTVTHVDVAANFLECKGPIQASSEAMTHGAIYRCNAAVQAVIHVHDNRRWEQLLNVAPTTDPAVPYGTSEMAWEIQRLFRDQSLGASGLLVMAGHTDGIITFGESLQEAGELLLKE